MAVMARYPDNYFDLACVDPPYGIGSGSSAIAAHYGGFDFVGCELDEDYYKAATERFTQSTAQETLF